MPSFWRYVTQKVRSKVLWSHFVRDTLAAGRTTAHVQSPAAFLMAAVMLDHEYLAFSLIMPSVNCC